MSLSDAKKLVGKVCSVSWIDRKGQEIQCISRIHDVTYAAMYGGYLVMDTDDIRLDKIISIAIVNGDGSADHQAVYQMEMAA
jgi:hypothetical protein